MLANKSFLSGTPGFRPAIRRKRARQMYTSIMRMLPSTSLSHHACQRPPAYLH